jgi:hypothetical protein
MSRSQSSRCSSVSRMPFSLSLMLKPAP